MVQTMDQNKVRNEWEQEESIAHIHGWDFSHIHGRYEEENDLPWDYETIVRQYLTPDMRLLDYDTGGGEFLLSLGHPHDKTAATEGYAPNIELCKDRLKPWGIDFKPCNDPASIPYDDGTFDIVINRHGDFCAKELHRLLKAGGLFITEQVGGENDIDLIRMVLPDTPIPHPELNLKTQQQVFEDVGFQIVQAEEAFRPILFYDIGAFVWFARIIEWEFPGFSVARCFDQLLDMQKQVEAQGKIEGTIHRFLIVAKK